MESITIKHTKEVDFLCTIKRNYTPEQLIRRILNEAKSMGIIEDMPEFYGARLCDILEPEDIGSLWAKLDFPVKTIRYTLKAVQSLILMGLGDCPECGGELKEIDGEYRTIQQDYDCEPEGVALWTEMSCPLCGHRHSNNPNIN